MRMVILLDESDRKSNLSLNVMTGFAARTKNIIAEADLVGIRTSSGDIQLVKYRDGDTKIVSFREFQQMAFE